MNGERCPWCGTDPLYVAYHDEEWGRPVHDDRKLFEMLILEGAQAGLSWLTILRKRDGYRRVFHQFDPQRVAAMSDTELEAVLQDPGIVRNRLKVASARRNAKVFLALQAAHGSFDNWLWAHVDHQPVISRFARYTDVPTSTPLSDRISKALKKAGMNFVGSTVIYAYLQAVGVVSDHETGCPCHPDHATA